MAVLQDAVDSRTEVHDATFDAPPKILLADTEQRLHFVQSTQKVFHPDLHINHIVA